MNITWRPYQIECKKAIKERYKAGITEQLIAQATGCHIPGTLILMHDGSLRTIESIRVGELLMGDDSTPRRVLKLLTGTEIMAKIKPIKGKPFIVNLSHILSLKKTTTPGKYPGMADIVNISVIDYISKNKHFKHLYKLYRTGVNFERDFSEDFNHITPYLVGLWLGDGASGRPIICSNEPEIDEYLFNLGFKVNKYHKGNGLYAYYLSIENAKFDENPIWTDLRKFIYEGEKCISERFLAYNYIQRLEILAGLLDSDGSLTCNGYDFVNKNITIANASVYLARSLGLAAYIKKVNKRCTNTDVWGKYYRVSISGETSIIPCKVVRKIAKKRVQRKNALVTGFNVELLSESRYYGFEINENHLYCMGDFTVTHNTGKRLQAVNLAKHFDRTLFVAHREELIMQAYYEIEQYWPINVGIIKGKLFEVDKKIVVASVQTLCNRLHRIDPNTFDLILVDECFPAGTKVDGIRIENFEPGWIINSFNHNTGKREDSTVTKVMKRKYSGRLYDLGYFKCTPNHPIFITGIGYCLAKEIYYAYICYKVMRYGFKAFTRSKLFKLWDKIFFRKIQFDPKSIHSFSQKRFWMLLTEMQKRMFQQGSFYYDEQDKSKVRFTAHEGKQSDVQSSIIRQNEEIIERSDIPSSWRKRKTDKTTKYYCGTDPFTDGIPNNIKTTSIKRAIITKLLQSRSSLSRSKTSNRNRWKDSPLKTLEILRQSEDGNIKKSRLDYIKIYKRTSKSKSGEDCKENYVYNLEVAKNNNYFANTILVHNCHHYVSPTYLKSIRHFNHKLRTCWTATPKRLDGISLTNIAQEIVYQYRIEDGITDGWLAPLEAYQIRTEVDLSKIKKVAGDFNQKQLSEVVDSEFRNNLIAKKYLEYAKDIQTLAFCVDIDHAYNLRDVLREHNIDAHTVVSDIERCPNRTELVNQFQKGEIGVLTNVNILTEGFDYTDVGCILMGRPTESETLYIQSIGRGTRLKSEKYGIKHGHQKCIILDFVDNSGKHSLVNTWELEKHKPIEDRMFLSQEHKNKLIEEREKRIRTMEVKFGKDQRINLLELPEVRVWDSEKMLEPASEKQLNWIKRMGVWQENVEYTKAMASEVISAQPAQSWELQYLAQNGYDISQGATLGQYQRVKQSMERRNKFQIN